MIFSVVWASMPLPAYDDVRIQAHWHEINRLIEVACEPGPGGLGCVEDPLREAIAKATTFQETVTVDARMEYLIGLAYRGLNDKKSAEVHLQMAVDLDPNRTDAWHDLGELLLDRSAIADAKKAFTEVDRRLTRGSRAWVGPFRLAEVAAHEQDVVAFEKQLRTALSRGFNFRFVLHDTEWRGFAADPVIGPSVAKLVTVYGTREQLRTLTTPPR